MIQTTEVAPEAVSKIVYVIDGQRDCRLANVETISRFGYRVIEFESAYDFLGFSRPSDGACALVSDPMIGTSARDFQGTLSAQGDNIPLIFLAGRVEMPWVVDVMRRGAFSVLERPVSADQLRTTLQELFAGDRVSVSSRVPPSRESLEKARLTPELSRREREVANLVATGYSNKKIACALGLSEKTIEKYRSNCVRKLRVRSSAEMVRAIVTAEMMGIGSLDGT
jgi:FixJ family two-component response regulator